MADEYKFLGVVYGDFTFTTDRRMFITGTQSFKKFRRLTDAERIVLNIDFVAFPDQRFYSKLLAHQDANIANAFKIPMPQDLGDTVTFNTQNVFTNAPASAGSTTLTVRSTAAWSVLDARHINIENQNKVYRVLNSVTGDADTDYEIQLSTPLRQDVPINTVIKLTGVMINVSYGNTSGSVSVDQGGNVISTTIQFEEEV